MKLINIPSDKVDAELDVKTKRKSVNIPVFVTKALRGKLLYLALKMLSAPQGGVFK